ncbi:uncharacterized protein LOC117101304 [Anneissia japonica]|uniref:uncharacterized protein LOC117101304 n=1 Tax=Anneissia japonica TaxID=1529436 RepID=UPI001425B35F|nr:uncharacterized protein LOC117101304 [Anneissia japonica]XP_033097161.1 uncharacterized protein LOC117101304 [Anneissia japonica]XP_033097162.1 uncharacterized protein LOC117101304 [Anneissia japonica]
MSDLGKVLEKSKKDLAERLESFNNLDVDECLECRLVGAGGAILTGIYIAYVGKKRHQTAKYPRLSRVPSVVATACLFSIGICRLINFNPWEKLNIDPLKIFDSPESKSSDSGER